MAAMTAAPMTDARTRQADALVEGLQREAGGKLTVFLGAAPGVGKTYTMLTRAQEQLRRGVDLVVGLVETHGRAETQALLEGLPQLPLKDVAYHGHALQEMDLDAVLARHPALVLVDELAASTVNLRLSYWVNTATYDAQKVRSAAIRLVKTAFEQAGISMPGEVREITFPAGLRVDLQEPSGEAGVTFPSDSTPTAPDNVGTHIAEGDLKNTDSDIERQAQASRLPEGGENLL